MYEAVSQAYPDQIFARGKKFEQQEETKNEQFSDDLPTCDTTLPERTCVLARRQKTVQA